MPLKAIITTILRTLSLQGETSMGDALEDLQVVTIAQLKDIISYIEGNNKAFNKKPNNIKILKIKLLIIKQYNRSHIGLKGYLIQILLKLRTESLKLNLAGDMVTYIGIFLIE